MTKVSITVEPSAEHPNILDVKDAMQQVLDFFDLISSDEDKATYVWNLTFAGTNSPFRAEAEAVSLDPAVNVSAIAQTRLQEASAFLDDVSHGRKPARALSKRRHDAARKLMRRNTNGVGRTIAKFDRQPNPLTVTPTIAARALAIIEQVDAETFDLLPTKRNRMEIGSVEGTLLDVGTDYNQPAIHIKERRSGRTITCRVDQALMDGIARSADFVDVWEHRRVIVRGKIYYDTSGDVIRVHARSIRQVNPRDMTLRDIEDRNFTGDLDTAEYLNRLREGDVG
ncbi:MAG: hypothetical protein EOS03_13610 [Mesorhizobium sp.]|uniref:hypothetical protein n=1 Tax=Mesorhizobium sp. TaxID=1871066 RepID=UPI000FE5B603|nr:hypothetical protein [Mesorhizobium sp.]RWN47378.1 MAG: hypothetical protein EOS03_13610 [Mesorhizobium sp.]